MRSVPSVFDLALPLLVAALLVVAGCSDSTSAPELDDPDEVLTASLEISFAEDSMGVGKSVEWSASPRGPDGNPVSRSVQWTSSDSNVASVITSGLATGRVEGVSEGRAVITARSDGQEANLEVEVLTGLETIGPAGGSIGPEEGPVTVVIPQGAVTQNTRFVLNRIPSGSLPEGGVPELTYTLEPAGLELAHPAEVEILFDPESLAGDFDVRLLAVHQDSGDRWRATPGHETDLEDGEAEGELHRTGPFGLLQAEEYWMAVGDGNEFDFAVSTNGFTWSGEATGLFNTGPRDLATNGESWLAARFASIGISSGSSNWEPAQLPEEGNPSVQTLHWHEGRWLAGVRGAGSNPDPTLGLMESTDGFTWSKVPTPFVRGVSVIGTNENTVIIGGPGSEVDLAVSTDGGATWTGVDLPVGSSPTTVVWNGEIWVLGVLRTVGSGTIFTSPDGLEWTLRDAPVSQRVAEVAWNGEIWVGVGTGDALIMTSPDGIDWTPQASPFEDVSPAHNALSVAALNGRFVVGGTSSQGDFDFSVTSTDGSTWERVRLPFGATTYKVRAIQR